MVLAAQAQVRYVKPGGTGNGSSWANAAGSIQDMIDYTSPGGQVWVAGGTYNLTATLQMKDGVSIYGGFFGNETSIEARPKSDLDGNGTIEAWEFTYTTVLSGQNARQVLNQAANFTVETVIDGVTIANGRILTTGAGAYLRRNTLLVNSIIRNNNIPDSAEGGGIYNNGSTVSHCRINGNSASCSGNGNVNGGGIYNTGGGIITDCLIDNNTVSISTNNIQRANGGGVFNDNGTVTNCMISNNTNTASASLSSPISGNYCYAFGGGVYNIGTVTNCTITENKTSLSGNGSYCSYGGGIYNEGSITNCIVTNNIANAGSGTSSAAQGGGIYVTGNSATISNCNIIGNTASKPSTSGSYPAYGGGIYCDNTTAKIIDCVVKNNKTVKNNVQDGQGGGIYQGRIIRCRIENNTSGDGGGFYGSNVYHCLILNNNATTNGGGGFLSANGKSINNTFVSNTAGGRGGGIYFNTNTVTSATNCIFWKNYAPMWEQIGTPAGASAPNVTYSAIQEQYTGTGNIVISEDNEIGQIFLSPATNIYQLHANSPCINTGSNAVLTTADTTDLAGNTRIYGGIVDMGAYERQGINPPTYTISGQITNNGSPLEGVTMTYTGGSSVVTNEFGKYSIAVYQGANITITPTLEGYIFTPLSITCNNITENLENQNFVATATFIPVTNITNVPNTATAGTPLTLTGTVVPSNATNKNITWSVQSAGTTGATISGNTLNTTAAGTVTVRATITNGLTESSNYTQNFDITVIVMREISVLATPTNGGTVTGGGSFPQNTSHTVTATANANYAFLNWLENGAAVSTSASYTFTITGNRTLTANFVSLSDLLAIIAQLQTDTAALNQQINNLQIQIANLQSDLTNCNTNNTNLQNQITGLQNNLTNCNTNNTNLQNQLNTCENEKDNLQELLDACLNSSVQSPQSAPLKIYPNPVLPNGILNIENGELKYGDKIEIFDMNGKLISVNFATGVENSINIGALPQGTYLLRLAGKQGVKFEVR